MARYRSSFNGRIQDIPVIYVDNFEKTNKLAYFLSHCHTDHTEGLYTRELICGMKKSGAKIYMTEESMKIVRYEAERAGVYDICDFIQPLKLCTTTVSIGNQFHIEVTLIPAGHCLGSVMFLFRLNHKTILYTGDFRIRSNDISKYAQLHKKGEPINIDVMYVDTTFITLEHPEFAKRSDSVDEMLDKVDVWLKQDASNRIAIHTSGGYTCEYVFNKIYKHLGLKVCVDKDKWELYQHFPNILSTLTNGEHDPKIHLCKNIRYKKSCHHNSLADNNYLSVHLSANLWRNYDDERTALKDGFNFNTIDVCFATHCSRREILSFVNYFAPGKVVGFPNPYNPETPEKVFDDEYIPSPKRMLKMEAKEAKIESSILKNLFH